MNGHVTKENIRVANKHIQKCSISLVLRKRQIKPVRHYFLEWGGVRRRAYKEAGGNLGVIGSFTIFFSFFVGTRTYDHQLPKNQKIMLLKSLDVSSACRASKLLYVCTHDRSPFLASLS